MVQEIKLHRSWPVLTFEWIAGPSEPSSTSIVQTPSRVILTNRNTSLGRNALDVDILS